MEMEGESLGRILPKKRILETVNSANYTNERQLNALSKVKKSYTSKQLNEAQEPIPNMLSFPCIMGHMSS